MVKKSLSSFFEEFLDKESLFINRGALTPSYPPESILHRDKEVNQIAKILAPLLKQEKPSNLFVYGNTGTGKTLSVSRVAQDLEKTATKRDIPLKVVYTNCKLKRVSDTEYRLVAHLSSFFKKSPPATGLPTDEIYKMFYDGLEKEKKTVLIILDEVDQLVRKAGDNILYNLARINEDLRNSQVSIVGISNDTTFMERIDPRVKSSLSEEDIFFAPYNALQLQDILRDRAAKTFKENALSPGLIEKCAAYAAREHGDARKAIELLRVAGEIAERNNNRQATTEHLDEAEEKLEKEKIFDVVKTQPKQFQAVLLAIITTKNAGSVAYTGEIYDSYRKVCFRAGLRPLTQRRVSGIIHEFESMGIINTKTISKGRYGRTRDISLSVSSSAIPMTKKILEDDLIPT